MRVVNQTYHIGPVSSEFDQMLEEPDTHTQNVNLKRTLDERISQMNKCQ